METGYILHFQCVARRTPLLTTTTRVMRAAWARRPTEIMGAVYAACLVGFLTLGGTVPAVPVGHGWSMLGLWLLLLWVPLAGRLMAAVVHRLERTRVGRWL